MEVKEKERDGAKGPAPSAQKHLLAAVPFLIDYR